MPFATIAGPKVSLANNYHASIMARLRSQMRLSESSSWTCADPNGMTAPCAVQALRYGLFYPVDVGVVRGIDDARFAVCVLT